MKVELIGVTAGYGRRAVAEDVNLTIPSGGVVTLVGPNGSGKSTLLKTVGRILRPLRGRILLDGRELGGWDTARLARKMAILPQTHESGGELTVEELAAMGRFAHRRLFGAPSDSDAAATEEALAAVGMTRLRHCRLSKLSGGERQKAWLAMTLAQRPELLLLDEPTTGLDLHGQLEVVELVREWNLRKGVTVLMVLHDLNLAAQVSHRLAAMKEGRIVKASSPEEMLTPGVLREVFDIETQIVSDRLGGRHSLLIGR